MKSVFLTKCALFSAFAEALSTSLPPSAVPKEVISTWLASQPRKPMRHSVLFFPPEYYSEDVSFLQVATGSRCVGIERIQEACDTWEDEFQSDTGDVTFQIDRVSSVSPTTIVTQWNVTWVPSTIQWLESLATWNRWDIDYIPYVDLADQVSTFSYRALFDLFWTASRTKVLRLPLACVQGTTTCEFSNDMKGKTQQEIVSIREDLGYAIDIGRGSLKNRKCAQDLKLFLEAGRRQNQLDVVGNGQQWDDVVLKSLPWSSVPGMNSLEYDPNASGEEWVPFVFVGLSLFTVFAFAAFLAPELIGQSLFGPPNYIVQPSDLNSIY